MPPGVVALRLLIVEDEVELAETVRRALGRAGWAVDLAADAAEAEEKAGLYAYDAVVLDLNLPDLDGVELCRRLRAGGLRAPVLMLTARHRVSDRVQGLDAGADDYLVKPFHLAELQARLRALVRRAWSAAGTSGVAGRAGAAGGPGAATTGTTLRVGRLTLDPAALEAAYDGRPLRLTVREFAVLEHLARRSPAVVSAEELLEHVWDERTDPFTNTVRVHVANLRRKLREATGESLIETVIGRGYRLCAR